MFSCVYVFVLLAFPCKDFFQIRSKFMIELCGNTWDTIQYKPNTHMYTQTEQYYIISI